MNDPSNHVTSWGVVLLILKLMKETSTYIEGGTWASSFSVNNTESSIFAYIHSYIIYTITKTRKYQFTLPFKSFVLSHMLTVSAFIWSKNLVK